MFLLSSANVKSVFVVGTYLGSKVHKYLYVSFSIGSPVNYAPAVSMSIKAAAVASVTRLGDLLDFGQLLKAFGNN